VAGSTDRALALAPAMNQAMWRDAATQAISISCCKRGVKIFRPKERVSVKACGDVGPGGMLLRATDIAMRSADCFEAGSLTGCTC